MRSMCVLTIYLAAIFVGGALVAPWAYEAAHLGGPMLAHAAVKPFSYFVINSFLVLAVAGMWPFYKALGVKSPRELGLTSPVGRGGDMARGALLGLASLAPVAVLALLGGGR